MSEVWSFTAGQGQRPKRARFNLLALEHGEYYFQDYSVHFYPSTSSNGAITPIVRSTNPFDTQQCPRHHGRLKLCSRGLLFEPADRLLPLTKYPFRHMETQMNPFRTEEIGAGVGEGFRFRCTSIVESKRNDEVGPYVTKRAGDSGAAEEWRDWTFSFSLLHTPLEEFLREARRLREVALRVKERGHGYEETLLRPVLEERLTDSTRKFDTIHLVDFRETLLLPRPVRVDRITPLLRNPGCIMVTDARVYFQPAELNNVGEPVSSFSLTDVGRAFKRRHMLRQTGLELFMQGGDGSAFFNFESSRDRDEFFDVLMSQPSIGPRARSARDVEAETRRWQRGQVSNYDYLVFLNTVAGRTVNDLTQYPVFPWVLRDYESQSLDLENPNSYRDLSRPIGALNAERLEYFRARFQNMPDAGLHPADGLPPPFLYGTHYSTPGYTLFFLVRSAPEEMLCLQNGRFDDPDRSFTSVAAAWDSVLHNHADLKELIPEFYAGDGSFLTNVDDLQLGVTQSRQRVGNVELPRWARSPRDFIRKMRKALESPYVSRRLHLWIDLIFGYKQRGQAAIEADNLFYHLTYEGAVDLEKVNDPRERAALESQISEFGQCPSLLFTGPHPRRDEVEAPVYVAPLVGVHNGPSRRSSNDQRFFNPKASQARTSMDRQCSPSSIREAPHTVRSPHDRVASPLEASSRHSAGSAVSTSSPPGSQAGSRPSSGGMVTAGAGDITSSVGALWKRGLAMAGAVGGAAAEATGGLRGLQGWQSSSVKGEGDTHRGVNSNVASNLMVSHRQIPTRADGNVNNRQGLHRTVTSTETERSSAEANAHSVVTAPPYAASTNGHESDPSAAMSSDGILDASKDDSHRGGASGRRGDRHTRPLKPNVPDTLTRTQGCENWGLDASKVEVRSGEPIVLHHDGVTCARLTNCKVGNDVRSIAGEVSGYSKFSGSWTEGGDLSICTSSKDCSLKICTLEREAGGSGPVSKAHTLRRLAGEDLPLSCCALTRDAKLAIAGSWDNGLLLYSVQAACVLSRIEGAHQDGVSCLALHEVCMAPASQGPGGAMILATGSWDAAVKVWHVVSCELHPAPILELFDMEAPVQALAFDGAGKALAACGEDGLVSVWDASSGALFATFNGYTSRSALVSIQWVAPPHELRGCKQTGACLITASASGEVNEYSPLGMPLGSLRLDSEVMCMSSDGRCTFVACADGSLRVLRRAANGGFVQTLRRETGLEGPLTCLEVRNTVVPNVASNTLIVVGNGRGTIRVWDVLTSRGV